MRQTLALLAGAGALAFGVAACGGSSSSSSSAAGGSTAATSTGGATATTPSTSTSSSGGSGGSASSSASTKLTIMAMPSGALMFTKNAYTVKAGTVELTFENKSGEGHNLFVQQGTNGKVLGGTPTISSGSKTLTLKLTPGKYTYYCNVPGHRAAGMLGTLTVT